MTANNDVIQTLRAGLAQIDAALDLAEAGGADGLELEELDLARNELSIAIDHFESESGPKVNDGD